MIFREFYRLAVEAGMDNDLRGRSEAEKILKKTKEDYAKLPAEKKKYWSCPALDGAIPISLCCPAMNTIGLPQASRIVTRSYTLIGKLSNGSRRTASTSRTRAR